MLALYALPYDPQFPVVCFDERPCFLIGDERPPVPMTAGHPKREHYAYEKLGSAALLAAIEPLTGKRLGMVESQRTMAEYTKFFQALAEAYPHATKIRVVQDNLNTHHFRSFYTHLPAEEAFALSQRFAFIYTPKGASWLNMIECEFSVVSRQCLNRRIPTLDQLRTQVLALLQERSDRHIRIQWQFTQTNARSTLNRAYARVNPANSKCQKT